MPRAHINNADIDEDGKVHKWTRIDFMSVRGVLLVFGTLLGVLAILWGLFTTFTINVLDVHIRKVVREEVPLAVSSLINAAVETAAKPHMDIAARAHGALQDNIVATNKRIDATDNQVKYNREEREKFQKELLINDEVHAAQMREISRQLADIYKYLLSQPHTGTVPQGGK